MNDAMFDHVPFLDILTRKNIPFSCNGDAVEIHAEVEIEYRLVGPMPRVLVVHGNFSLNECDIAGLPEELTVHGSLCLEWCTFANMPKVLSVDTNIYLANSNVSALPDNLLVQGDLNLGRTKIEELPEWLEVMGKVDLEGTRIKRFPASLRVGGTILPPICLHEVEAFMSTEEIGAHVLLASDLSGHARMEMLASLQDYPDLMQVYTKMYPGKELVVSKLRDGYHRMACAWPDDDMVPF